MINKLFLTALCMFYFSGIAQADCGGTPTRGILRNVISKQPIRSFFQKLRSNTSQVSSCAGMQSTPAMDQTVYQTQSVNCTQLSTQYTVPTYTYTQPTYQAVQQSACANCNCVQCNCTNCVTCMTTQSVAVPTYTVVPAQATFGLGVNVQIQQSVVPQQQTFGLGEAYTRAYKSASYRAANMIKGHVAGELLTNRRNSAGVGFASNNPNPRTCLGIPGQTSATCAVVRGPDGWYSTCVK